MTLTSALHMHLGGSPAGQSTALILHWNVSKNKENVYIYAKPSWLSVTYFVFRKIMGVFDQWEFFNHLFPFFFLFLEAINL